MIAVGIDCGAKYIKTAVLENDNVLYRATTLAGVECGQSAFEAYQTARQQIGIPNNVVTKIAATGSGSKMVDFAPSTVAEVGATALGMQMLRSDVRTLIDVGAQDSRAIKLDTNGSAVDYLYNEKCAAGAGIFAESTARVIQTDLEELGRLSLQSTQSIPINAQCAVFAESEMISLIQRQVPKCDIARAIHAAISNRIASMVKRLGIEERVALVGGMAKNIGFVKLLGQDLGLDVLIVDEAEYVTAIGAARSAAAQLESSHGSRCKHT